MVALAVIVGISAFSAGYILGKACDASYSTFDHGASWFKGGDVRRPVGHAGLVHALQAVRRECEVPARDELTIEVRA